MAMTCLDYKVAAVSVPKAPNLTISKVSAFKKLIMMRMALAPPGLELVKLTEGNSAFLAIGLNTTSQSV